MCIFIKQRMGFSSSLFLKRINLLFLLLMRDDLDWMIREGRDKKVLLRSS